jgi:hypothetical protein
VRAHKMSKNKNAARTEKILTAISINHAPNWRKA